MLGVCSSAVNSCAYFMFSRACSCKGACPFSLSYGLDTQCIILKSDLTTVLIDGLGQITIFTIRSIRGGRTAGQGVT